MSNYTKIPSGDEDSLRVAIATKGPVAVAIDASHKSFSFYGYGVYYEEQCGKEKERIVLYCTASNIIAFSDLINFAMKIHVFRYHHI